MPGNSRDGPGAQATEGGAGRGSSAPGGGPGDVIDAEVVDDGKK